MNKGENLIMWKMEFTEDLKTERCIKCQKLLSEIVAEKVACLQDEEGYILGYLCPECEEIQKAVELLINKGFNAEDYEKAQIYYESL